MFQDVKKVTVLLLLCLLAAGLILQPAHAATKKKKSKKTTKKTVVRKVKDKNFSFRTRGVEKKAIKLERGSTTLKFGKKGHGYIMFTAMKKKNYLFTVSGLKKHTRKSLPGKYYFCIMTARKKNPLELKVNKVKTNGGMSRNLYFWTKNIDKGSKELQYRKKRCGKLRLNVGQTAYLYFSCNAGDSLKLKIK
jgi:hypothetical protein